MSVNLNQLFPKPVTVKLAGREFLVSEFEMGDLAELQAWVESVAPHPLDAIKGHLDGLPERIQDRLVMEAYKEAKNYPPKVGTPDVLPYFNTPDGMAQFLWVALKKHNQITLDEVKALLPQIAAEDADRLQALANGTTAEEEVLAVIEKRRAKGGPKKGAARRTGASS